MRIAVAGAGGLIGSALRPALVAAGHEVVRLVRGAPAGPDEIGWDPAAGEIDAAGLAGIDAAVNLAGAGIGDQRWTEGRKQVLVDSRVGSTSLLARAMAALDPRPDVLVNASAIGYYGDRGDEVLTEEGEPGEGFLAELCVRWEAATEPAAAAGIRVALLRTGIVLSEEGGALPPMLLPFKLGLGGRMGSGDQYWSWIDVADEVAAIVHVLSGSLAGPVNLTAPNPVRNAEFVDTLGKVLRRPTWFPTPKLALRAVLGPELAQATVFEGQRVIPAKLQADGFEFSYPQLEASLRHVLGRAGT